MSYIAVFITASSKKEAEKITNAIVKARLAACVNIIGRVRSTFIWKQKKETASEVLLIVKTKRNLFDRLKKEVKRLHSYQTPEIIGIPIIAGDRDYLDWVDESLR